MRALVYHGPWELAVEDRPDPVAGPGQVVLEVLATGICGSDLHGFTGENGRRFPGQVMGHETVARVREVGANVEEPSEGDLVAVHPVMACGACPACVAGHDHRCPSKKILGVAPEISATFADYVVVPAVNAVRLPATLPVEYGALVEPLAVGRHAVERAELHPGEAVLVVGGGPIGQAAVLAARQLGAGCVVVSEPNERRRRLLGELGVTAIDPAAVELGPAASDVLGSTPTLVVDAVGSHRSVGDGLEAMDMGGRLVLVGMHEPQLHLAAYAVSVSERALIGSFCYAGQHFHDTAEWVATGPSELAHLIEGRVGWDGAIEAFRSLARGENPASKVLVFPGGA